MTPRSKLGKEISKWISILEGRNKAIPLYGDFVIKIKKDELISEVINLVKRELDRFNEKELRYCETFYLFSKKMKDLSL